mgnify:CR=1 FL=1
MAQSLDEAKALTYAPTDLKPFIKSLTKGKGKYNFQTFLAADNWKKTKGSMWTINVMLTDIDGIAKRLGSDKKTVGNKKVVDYVTTSGYKIRFKESLKTGAGKTPDAKTTRKQELGSAYIFGYALKYRRSGWKTEFDLMRDERMMKGLRKLYPEVEDTDWLTVYFKQHKVILDKFSLSNNEVTSIKNVSSDSDVFSIFSESIKELDIFAFFDFDKDGDLDCVVTVSYTHLTLPTKRIV